MRRPVSPKREKFAQLVAGGATKAEAYRQSFRADGMKPATVWSEASRVAADPLVSRRLAELQGKNSDDMAGIRASVLVRLNALADGAESESARVRALELLGKASGLFEEQSADLVASRTVIELRMRLEKRLRLMLEAAPASRLT
ncbi:MAG TPA: hypothetical protein VFI23_16165 [Rhizomicrobium sp.]|nr:hypothetical protein [Rhizomicrobium sp.]